MHRVAEVFGKAERQDNCRDAEDRQRRRGTPNLCYSVGLLIGKNHNEYRVSHESELNGFVNRISLYKTMIFGAHHLRSICLP